METFDIVLILICIGVVVLIVLTVLLINSSMDKAEKERQKQLEEAYRIQAEQERLAEEKRQKEFQLLLDAIREGKREVKIIKEDK